MSKDDFSYTIVPFKEHGFFWGTLEGHINMENIGRAYRGFLRHPDYAPHIDELLDVSKTSIAELTKNEFEVFRQAMKQQPDRQECMSAIVVGSQLDFGIGRMMGAQLDRDIPVNRAMFYSVKDALEWLRPGQGSELIDAHQAYLDANQHD